MYPVVESCHFRPLLLEVENKNLKTPLIQAIEKGDLSLVTLLITLGANVNNLSSYTNRSPIMTAVSLGFLNIAALLIDKGGNVKTHDVNGLNILHYAVDSNNIESVRFCVQQDIDINTADRNGWTPLHRAGTLSIAKIKAYSCFLAILQCDSPIIQLLLEHGAQKSKQDHNGFDYDKHINLAAAI